MIRCANSNTAMTNRIQAIASCLLVALSACGGQEEAINSDHSNTPQKPHDIIDAAIDAHGGFDQLKAASSWIADVRRFQSNDSYVIKQYYRPGMVRLEQDLGDGEKTGDVIGHPHCWGSSGPVSFPCSPETRENDRPRIIMEMGAQLWPLRENKWELLSAGQRKGENGSFDVVRARYIPLDSLAEFTFDSNSRLLRTISIIGVKEGVNGTHLHTYSDYKKMCGVLMPSHNVKSFDGDVWVEEDILSLECTDVPEEFFERPEQVKEGTFRSSTTEALTFACLSNENLLSPFTNFSDTLSTAIEENKLSIAGFPQQHFLGDGSRQLCAPIRGAQSGNTDDLIIRNEPHGKILSVYSLREHDDFSSIANHLLAEAMKRKLSPNGPMRLIKYDHDGMGSTDELVYELQLPVSG